MNKTLYNQQENFSTPKIAEPVSLYTLKNKIKESAPSLDRAASSEDMDKLKNLIKANQPAQTPTPVPKKPTKEVPEDVLRKILE